MTTESLDFELPVFVQPPEAPLRWDEEYIRNLDRRRTAEWRACHLKSALVTINQSETMVAFEWID